MKKNHYGQGGFSDAVWRTPFLVKYMAQERPLGYFSGNYFQTFPPDASIFPGN